ncbi:MAG TPA: HAMP domain-containing sensor histidine kinase [Solirubrobacteraceae bacterium]|nr:HAMP domain-containing sensor histidine kinase [Solirubrobacteraceae bacterium]
MRRRGLLGAAGAGLVAVAVAVGVTVLGAAHTLVVVAVLAGIAQATLAGARWVTRARRRGQAGPISTQLAFVIALVIAPVLLALIVLALTMFVSTDDAVLVGIILVLSTVVGIGAATWLSAGLSADVAAIRDALVRVGSGDREVRIAATSAAELRELAAQVSAMVDALAHEEAGRAGSEEARRLLVAHASHDLRTPITALALLAAAVDDEVVDERMRAEYVRRMLTHIEALSSLVDDLFELSRLQAGDIHWSLGQVGLPELVDETVAAMRTAAEARGVVVNVELPDALAPVRGNPEKLQRVLFNLIQNAIRHSPADGTVVVRARTMTDVVELEVEDRGAGIPPAERERIFDAFYRGGDMSRSGDGAGLGLAVAQAIVDAHGGRIWVADAPVGTRVRFSVPVAA